MRRRLEERRERSITGEGSHFWESDRRLRPFGSVVLAVNSPVAGLKIPEESMGGVSLGGLVVSLVESSVESSVGSLVEPSFVSVEVELSGGVKPLVSGVLFDGDKSSVSVEFDRAVELVMSVQL